MTASITQRVSTVRSVCTASTRTPPATSLTLTSAPHVTASLMAPWMRESVTVRPFLKWTRLLDSVTAKLMLGVFAVTAVWQVHIQNCIKFYLPIRLLEFHL